MAHDAQFLYEIAVPKPETRQERAVWRRETRACMLASGQLTLDAYWKRLRAGRHPFTPTFTPRSRSLPRAARTNRALSTDPYLRPTPLCDCHAPEVLALADDFRARTRGDWEYANAIFDFAKDQIDLCFDLPAARGVAGTLRRGFGTCQDKLHVLVALARAGGIPARYCTIGIAPGGAGVQSLTGDHSGIFGIFTHVLNRFLASPQNDPRAKRVLSFVLMRLGKRRSALKSALASGALDPARARAAHLIVELRIGDVWVAADPVHGDADCAANNFPLPRFGYEPLAISRLVGMVVNGSSEAVPIGWKLYLLWVVNVLLVRGAFDHFNRFIEQERVRGREILEHVGREEFIQRRAHLYRRLRP